MLLICIYIYKKLLKLLIKPDFNGINTLCIDKVMYK